MSTRTCKIEWRVVAVDGEPNPEGDQPCISYGEWTTDRPAADLEAQDMRYNAIPPYTDVWVEQRETFTEVRITEPHRIRDDSPVGR